MSNSTLAIRRRRRLAPLVGAMATAAALVLGIAPAWASLAQPTLVSQNPANWTPNVLDGRVNALAIVGNTMVVGGSFTQVQAVTPNAPVLDRVNLFAFDMSTGDVSSTFVPTVDGDVRTLVAAGDGTSVFVGGAFAHVNGTTPGKLARLDVATGTRTAGFKAPVINAAVEDAKLSNGRLLIAGQFTTVATKPRSLMASLDPATGAITDFANATFTGLNNGGAAAVKKFDVTADGSRLVAIGNFTAVNGSARLQVAMFDTSGSTMSLSTWATSSYPNVCSGSFDTYMRDLDFSPDGSFFVITTTGGPHGTSTLCDTNVRWETGATGAGQLPTWINFTGGDTSQAVAITGPVVYVGGHFRWSNNPYGSNFQGAGGVPRQGLTALDSKTGVPYSWNPGRSRGVGVFEMLATSDGLWIGDDTNWVGGENHARLAFFPLSGGGTIPPGSGGVLPNDIHLLGRTSTADASVLYRVNAGGPAVASIDDGPAWAADPYWQSPYRSVGSLTHNYGLVPHVDSTVPKARNDATPIGVFSDQRADQPGAPAMNWGFPVTSGTGVTVRLFFANRCACTSLAGQRVFNVGIDGTTVLTNFDAVAAAGNDTGTMRAFAVTSDGSVDISFARNVGDPMISAIEILQGTGTSAYSLNDDVRRRSFDGTTVGRTALELPTQSWHSVRGSFLIDGVVYSVWANGTMTASAYDGRTWAPPTPVALYGNTISSELPNVSGMFFDSADDRLYYTLSGDTHLYYRAFVPESRIVGAWRYTDSNDVSGVVPSRVQGMFLVDGQVYFADKTTGNLMRIAFAHGVFSGTAQTIDATQDWRANAMFLGSGAQATPPTFAPTASVSGGCVGLTCSFGSSGSNDPDGGPLSYAWSFGDGSSATGPTVDHTFAAVGAQTTRLVVTDSQGAYATADITVATTAPTGQAPIASFQTSCVKLDCTFDGGASSDPDGTVTAWAWNFGDSGNATGATASHTFAAPGSYTVGLTVTDDSGNRTAQTFSLTVSNVTSAIAFRDKSQLQGNATTFKPTVPSTAVAGDTLLMFASWNSSQAVQSAPAGWTSVGSTQVSAGDLRTAAYLRIAQPGDAGSTATLTFSSSTKASVVIGDWSGVDTANPIGFIASRIETTTTASHTTPAAVVTAPGSWVVSYWADKSSSTTTWTSPAAEATRASSIGSGTGHVDALLTDSGSLVPAGTRAGRTATADAASSKATMFSIALTSQ